MSPSPTNTPKRFLGLAAVATLALVVFAPAGAADTAPEDCERPGPDAMDYSCPPTSEVSWNWIDTSSGTTISNASAPMADDGNTSIELPFEVPWYGETQQTIHVSSNGFLCIDASCDGLSGTSSYEAQATPDPASPNDLLACAWTDLDPTAGGEIRYTTVGTSPDRTFVVEFDAVPHYGFPDPGATNTFQLQIEEDGEAYCMLDTVATDDSDADPKTTVGVEGPNGEIGVRYVHEDSSTFEASQVAVGFLTVPESVQGFSAAPDEDAGATETSWDEIPVAENYDVFRCEGEDCSPTRGDVRVADDEPAPPFDDASAEDSTVYCYAVQANYPDSDGLDDNDDGDTDRSELSAPACAIPNGPPLEPWDVTIDDVSTGFVDDQKTADVTLSWKAPNRTGGSPIETYHVRDDGNDGDNAVDNTTSETSTTITVTRECPGSWTFSITAENTDHTTPGPASKTVSASCEPPEAPNAPENVDASPGDNVGEVNVTWTEPSTGTNVAPITHYHVDRKDPDSDTWTTDVGTVDATEYVDADLATSQIFDYRVRAHNDPHDLNGMSATVDAVALGPPTGIQSPSAAQATDSDGDLDDAVDLDWQAPERDGGSAVTEYNVYRCDGVQTCTPADGTLIGETDQASLTDLDDATPIPCRTDLTYAITAENEHGESPAVEPSTVTIEDVCPDPPANLQAAPGVNELEVTWDEPAETGASDLIRYEIVDCTASDAGATCTPTGDPTNVDVDQTQLTQTDISANQTRCYTVRAENGDGLSLDPADSPACATTYSPPDPPDVAVNETGPLEATLAEADAPASLPGAWLEVSWTSDDSFRSVPDITDFEVQRKQVGSPQDWQDVDRTAENFTIGRPPSLGLSGTGDALSTGEWCYRVRAENLAGASDWSTPSCGDASPELFPEAPTDLTVDADLAEGEITVDWEAPEGELSDNLAYRIYRAGLPAGEDGFPFECAAITESTEFVDADPQLGIRYAYFVTATRNTQAACDSATLGDGGEPSPTNAAIVVDPPKPPVNVDATPGTDRGQVHVDWQAATPDPANADADEYRVERTNPDGSTTDVGSVDAPTTEVTDTVPQEATVYTYTVTAYNANLGLSSAESNGDTSIANGIPLAPDNFEIESEDVVFDNDNHKVVQARLSWDAPAHTGGSPLDTYELRQDTDENEEIDTTFTVDPPTHHRDVTLECPDTGSTSWAFDVTASNTEYADASPPSDSKGLDCSAPSEPKPPQNVEATPGDARGEVDLTWDKPADGADRAPVDHYRIDRKQVDADKWTDAGTTTDTTFTDTELADSTVYEFQIVAVNEAHSLESDSSGADDDDTSAPNGPPTEPLNLVVADATTIVQDGVEHLEVDLDWETPAFTGGSTLDAYEVRQGYTDATGTSTHDVSATATQTTLTIECPDLGKITFEVAAFNTAYTDASPASNPVERACGQLAAPSEPADVTATPGDARGEIALDWEAPSLDNTQATVDEYHVERKTTDATSFTQVATVEATSYTDAGLLEATVYEYRVLAHNTTEDLTSSPSDVADAIANGTPTAPSKPSVANANTYFEDGLKHKDVDLSWAAPDRTGGSALDTYRVAQDRGDDGSTDTTLERTHPDTQTTATLECPNAGETTWAFDVTASNTAHDDHGPASADTTITCTAPQDPNAPEGVRASPGSTRGEIVVDWTAPTQDDGHDHLHAPVTEYHVERTNPDDSTTDVGPVGAGTTSLSDDGLADSSEYTYAVTAHNHPHDLTSGTDDDTAIPAGPPTAPRSLQVEDQRTVFEDGAAKVEADLTWATPKHTGGAPIQSYTLYTTDGTTATEANLAATPRETTVTLACPGPWTVELTAENTAFDAQSPRSAPLQIDCSVPKPADLQASAGVRAAQIDWAGPADQDYQVVYNEGSVPDGADCANVECVTVSGTETLVTGLENEATYEFRVRTLADGTSELTSPATATTYGAPQDVTAAFASNPTFPAGGEQPPTIYVNWQHPSEHGEDQLGADAYRVERCLVTDRTPAPEAASACETAGTAPGDDTGFADTGMGPGVYCYQVEPLNSADEAGLPSETEQVSDDPSQPLPAECDAYVRHDTVDNVPEPPGPPTATVTVSYFDGNAAVDTDETPPTVTCPANEDPADEDTIRVDGASPPTAPSGPSGEPRCIRVHVTATEDGSEVLDESVGVGVPDGGAPDPGSSPEASVTFAYHHENAEEPSDSSARLACAGEPASTGTVELSDPSAPPTPSPDARCAEITVRLNLDGSGEPDVEESIAVGLPDAGVTGSGGP